MAAVYDGAARSAQAVLSVYVSAAEGRSEVLQAGPAQPEGGQRVNQPAARATRALTPSSLVDDQARTGA